MLPSAFTKPNFPNKKPRRASFDCLRVCIHPFIHSRSTGGSIGPCLLSSHSLFQTFLIKNTGGWVSMVCVSASIQYQVSSVKYQVSSIKYQVSSIKCQVSSACASGSAASKVTVAILAQGTSWAVAVTQAFLSRVQFLVRACMVQVNYRFNTGTR